MHRIRSWGLVALMIALTIAFAGDARAEAPPTAAVGLGLTVGGAALTTVSSVVLIGMTSCHPDATGEGCPPRVERKAAVVGLVLGVLTLAVGIPLYAMSDHDQRNAAYRQVGTAIVF